MYDEWIIRFNADKHWASQCRVLLEFHEYMQSKVGGKDSPGKPKKGEKIWGVRNTAATFDLPIGNTSEMLTLARNLRKNVIRSNYPDRRAAMAALKRIQNQL